MKTPLPVMLVAAVALSGCDGQTGKSPRSPNPRFLKTWPEAGDLAWFQEAEGKSEKEVLTVYGPPTEKTALEGGRTRWHYPWAARAEIEFENGVATRVYYTSGY